jgi:DNA polymerase
MHRMLNPESGRVIDAAFAGEFARCSKGLDKYVLDADIMVCHKCDLGGCPRACGWGDLNARHMIVGQSLHEPGAQTGIPFIVGCGLLIDAALRLVGMSRTQIFLTNAVHCHPERNATSTPAQLKACRPWLTEEIRIVQPDMLICLGNDARASVAKIQEADVIPGGCIIVHMIHPAATLRMSPEAPQEFVLRLAKELERV